MPILSAPVRLSFQHSLITGWTYTLSLPILIIWFQVSAAFHVNRSVRLVVRIKHPRKITERRKVVSWLTVWEASASVCLSRPSPSHLRKRITCQQAMCSRKAAYLMAARRQKETEMGPDWTHFSPQGPIAYHLPTMPLYKSALCPPHSQPGTDEWESWTERSELSRTCHRHWWWLQALENAE